MPGSVRLLGRIVLAGLLVTFLVGLVQNIQRIQELKAEPTPLVKRINKHQAWRLIYHRTVFLRYELEWHRKHEKRDWKAVAYERPIPDERAGSSEKPER